MAAFDISKDLVVLIYDYEKRQPGRNHLEIMFAF